MDIVDARAKKLILENQIIELMREFENETGLHIDDFKLYRQFAYTGMLNSAGEIIAIELEVKI